MEVQISHVMPFGNNGDIKQLKNGSARRRSHTRDSSYCDVQSEPVTRRSSSQVRPHSPSPKTTITADSQVHSSRALSDANLSCGVIPHELQSRLLDLKDYKSRTHAIEELKNLVQRGNFTSLSYSNVVGFISFLCTLLDDSNFTVVLITLDVLHCLVINLGQDVKDFLKPVISATVKLLGDGKITVKQDYMKIYMKLMKVAGPRQVLTVLLENLKHKNSRVREEVINICIVSLLTYPSEDFNLPLLACEIAPCLIDSKRKVRHAALEAFAVLAASMGPGKSSLLKAVDEVELQENGEGLMNAVQARLARKTLPRISPHGLVEYALPFPSSAQIRATPHLPGADTDWLLTGTRAPSRSSQVSGHNGREMVPHIDPVARRMLSAGKGKNKFPWESEDPGVLDVFPGTPTSDKLPSTIDVNHTPVVRTPSAKSRSSSTSQTPTKSSSHSEISPSFSDNSNAPVTLKASIVRLPSGQNDLNRSKPVPPITKGAKSLPELSSIKDSYIWNHSPPVEKTMDKENFAFDLLGIRDEDDHGKFFSAINVHHTPIVKTPSAKTRNSISQAPTKYSNRSDSSPAFSDNGNTSIPLKASIERLPSGLKDLNRSKPVPPITKGIKPLPEINSSKGTSIWNRSQPFEKTNDEESIAIDLMELGDNEEDDREEMISSLRNLRNSAAKKRATITGSLSDPDSPNSMGTDLLSTPSPIDDGYSESGIYSRESLTSPLSPTPQLKRVSQVTSVPKPKLRPGRLLSPRGDAVKKTDSLQQGMAASEKAVTVIGQRMNHKIGEGDEETPPAVMRRPSKDLQKASRPMKGITGSVTNFQKMNHPDIDMGNVPLEDSVAVIGKGVFEMSPPACQSHSQTSFSTAEDASPAKPTIKPPTGLYGRAVLQSSQVADSDESVTMSKSAREKMRQKKETGLKEMTDCSDPDRKERLSQTDPSPVRRDSWRLRSDCTDVADMKTPPLKRTSSTKRTAAQRSAHKDRSSVISNSEIMDPSVIRELARPQRSLAEAFKLLSDDDWEKKIEGLNIVRSLSAFHSDVVFERLHDLKIVVTQEVKNLRSTVSRAAIACLGDMFSNLKKNMDFELDNCVRILLSKAAESNIFMREDVDKALDAMVQNVTPVRALNALLNGGLSHLNTAVKRCTAQHLCDLLERMGPGWILSGIKDITDRAVPAIAKFAQDGSQETRFYGRKMLHYLTSHPDFDKMLDKYVPAKELPYIRDLIKQIQSKGVGEILETPSARGRRCRQSESFVCLPKDSYCP